jgi:pilus assembly protein Flp/PilA
LPYAGVVQKGDLQNLGRNRNPKITNWGQGAREQPSPGANAGSGKGRVAHSQTEVSMNSVISRFLRDESGVTAIEYGLIAALLAIVIIAAVTAVGTSLSTTFSTVANSL